MLKQLVRDGLAILWRPTAKTFQGIVSDNWKWAFIYLAIGTAITALISAITNVVQAPLREQQRVEFANRFGESFYTSFLDNLQNPFLILALGIFGFFFVIVLWILLPYGLGRAVGGAPAFGKFAYLSSAFSVPISILDAVLALTLSGALGGLFLMLSLSLDAFRFYLVYVNLRAVMELSRAKSLLVILVPIMIAIVFFCGLIIFFVVTSIAQ